MRRVEDNQKASIRLPHVQGDEEQEPQNYNISSLGERQTVDASFGAQVFYCFIYVFSLTPLTILLNSLHTVEDASVLLQFLPSVDSGRLKSCSVF